MCGYYCSDEISVKLFWDSHYLYYSISVGEFFVVVVFFFTISCWSSIILHGYLCLAQYTAHTHYTALCTVLQPNLLPPCASLYSDLC